MTAALDTPEQHVEPRLGRQRLLTALNRRIERRPEIQCAALEDAASLAAAVKEP